MQFPNKSLYFGRRKGEPDRVIGKGRPNWVGGDCREERGYRENTGGGNGPYSRVITGDEGLELLEDS